MNFNGEEKEILTHLVEYDFINLKTVGQFLSERILPDNNIRLLLTTDEKVGNILFCEKEKQKNAVKYIVLLKSLLNRLEESRMITFFPVKLPGNIDLLGTKERLSFSLGDCKQKNLVFSNNEYISAGDCNWCDINDNVIFQGIQFKESEFSFWNVVHSYPVISEDLIELVKSNFKTTEQKSLFWTRIAAVASFGAFLASIIIPHACSTRIDQEQYDGFMKSDTTILQEITTNSKDIINVIDKTTYQITDTTKQK